MALPPFWGAVEASELSSILDAPLSVQVVSCAELLVVDRPRRILKVSVLFITRSVRRARAAAAACETRARRQRECSLPCDFRGAGQIGEALPNAAKKSAEIPFEYGEAGSGARVPGPPDFLAPTSSASPAAAPAACACSPPRCPSRCYLSGGVSGSGAASPFWALASWPLLSTRLSLSLLSLRCAATAPRVRSIISTTVHFHRIATL